MLKKKGIFLTFISITLIAAFLIVFTPPDINLRKDIPVIKARVYTVNEYVLDLENVYLKRTLQATGIKAIASLILYINKTGDFLTDFAPFSEVLLNGTINNADIDLITEQSIMAGNTYYDWLERINNTGRDTFNIITYFVVNDIKVYQIRPWLVNIDANISFSVHSETASWNKSTLIKAEISIEDFVDPYYLKNTDGLYKNTINKTNIKFDEWNAEKVREHIKHGTYVHFEGSNAPSFLMRFVNDVSASGCCGIESIINTNVLSDLGLSQDVDVSYSDYLFWSTAPDCDNLNLYTVDSISSVFPNTKFDLNHLALYNILDAAQKVCPPE